MAAIISDSQEKFLILQSLTTQGDIDRETADKIYRLNHLEIAKYLGNGDLVDGEEKIRTVANFRFGQALIYDLKQNPKFIDQVRPFEQTFPSMEELMTDAAYRSQELHQKIATLIAQNDALKVPHS